MASSASSSSSSTKKVLILGEMNVGKSFILNRLLGLIAPNWFRSGCETQALTSIDKTIQTENGNINVRAFVTPGLNVPKETGKIIDSIMKKLITESFHQIIIVIEYGRTSNEMFNYLEILERCLNGVIDRSVMLIINKVPNKSQIERNAQRRNSLVDLEQSFNDLRRRIARVFNFEFSAEFSLLDEQNNEDEKENEVKLELIRNFISSCEVFNYSNGKTWSELIDLYKIYKECKETKIENLNGIIVNELMEQIEKDKKNIDYNKRQLELLDITNMNDISKPIKNLGAIQYLFRPPFVFTNLNLQRVKEKKVNQIKELGKAKGGKEERLNKMKCDVEQLNKEREMFLNEINRLQSILEEN